MHRRLRGASRAHISNIYAFTVSPCPLLHSYFVGPSRRHPSTDCPGLRPRMPYPAPDKYGRRPLQTVTGVNSVAEGSIHSCALYRQMKHQRSSSRYLNRPYPACPRESSSGPNYGSGSPAFRAYRYEHVSSAQKVAGRQRQHAGYRLTLQAPDPPSSRSKPSSNSLGYDFRSGYV